MCARDGRQEAVAPELNSRAGMRGRTGQEVRGCRTRDRVTMAEMTTHHTPRTTAAVAEKQWCASLNGNGLQPDRPSKDSG